MKKILLLTLMFGLMVIHLNSIVPSYYGARALGLGYSGSAFCYDVNAVFINPSLLASYNMAMTGYQYQNNYQDYKGFNEKLQEVSAMGLSQYESLSAIDKSGAFDTLKELFTSKVGMYGFSSNLPGFTGRGYGVSYSVINSAVISPVEPGSGASFWNKAPTDVTNDDIASLKMNVMGLHYKQLTLAYSLGFSRNMFFGVSFHYLRGKVTDTNVSITDGMFKPAYDSSDYLKDGWGNADEKFSRVIFDLSAAMDVGRHFKVSLVSKNIGNPVLKTARREIVLKNRMIAGLAFRPAQQWGVYLDVDIVKTDLLHNGSEMQPISFGIEKGFFNNRLFLRGGFLNDLTEKHFFGSKSNILYGLGMGFNMSKFVVDVAIGLNGDGSVKSLAVSGFILLK